MRQLTSYIRFLIFFGELSQSMLLQVEPQNLYSPSRLESVRSRASMVTPEPRKSPVLCTKHVIGGMYHSHIRLFTQLKELSKSLPPALEEIRKLAAERVHSLLARYLDLGCECWEIVSQAGTTWSMHTIRLGASWVSDFNDVANLADVENL